MDSPRLEQQPLKIRQVIAEYRAGRIVIPEFQRDYVWRPRKAARLIDSLYRGYPISSLLLWVNADVDARPRLRAPRPSREGPTSWLIDGQQRVITLSRCMSGDEGLDVLFNPETEEFSLANAALRSDPAWARLADIWDEAQFRVIRRNLPPGPRGERREARLDRLRLVLDYEIPSVRMVDHPFESAVEAFTRINTYGVKLRGEDIESARVAARHAGFVADDVVPFLQEIRQAGLSRLNVMHLFRVCAFVARPDGRDRTPLHELSQRQVRESWDKTAKATKTAMQLVRSELGLVNMDILWSGALLVPIIAVCATRGPRERDAQGLAGWLAAAALSHRYSRSSETALDQDLRACRADDPVGALLTNIRRKYKDLIATEYEFTGALADKSALLAAYIACRQVGLRDLFTNGSVALHQSIERHHILPRAQFPEAERPRADCIANIAFITEGVNKAVGATGPEVYLPKVAEATLRSQCIPTDPALWRVDRAEEFWAERRKLLANAFNAYLRAAVPNRRGLAAAEASG